MWKDVIVNLAMLQIAMAALVFHCPEGTTCPEPGYVEANSFDFILKLGPKQYQTIRKLAIIGASVDKVPPELKYLKDLEYLDLSDNNVQLSSIPMLPHLMVLKLTRNNLKSVTLSLLPRHLKDLDLSGNLLSVIPKDWPSLPSLTVLHLQKNLLDCDCYSNNIATYLKLVKHGVAIPEPIYCHSPKYFSGKSIDSVNCTTEDEMINDQPEEVEGSGTGMDIFSESVTSQAPYWQEIEEEKIEKNELIDDKEDLPVEETTSPVTPPGEEEEEGSGNSEGSGFMPIEPEEVPACIFDCVTLQPVGANDSKNDSGKPLDGKTLLEYFNNDVITPLFEDPTSTTTPTTPTTTHLSKEEVTEKTIVKTAGWDNLKEVEPTEEPGKQAKMETALNENNYAVYIVVISVLLLAVIFLVFLVKKRKSKQTLNKNRRDNLQSQYGEEMKPLEKPAAVQAVNEKNGKSPSGNNVSEHVPLMNGQNGKARDEPVLKSYTPLEHPEEEAAVIRDKPQLLLTPHTERVTIRASEIPESVPKTPVLVHRQKNSEGEIVTTVVPP